MCSDAALSAAAAPGLARLLLAARATARAAQEGGAAEGCAAQPHSMRMCERVFHEMS